MNYTDATEMRARASTLTPHEISAICRTLGAPLPTDHVPLDRCLEAIGLDIVTAYSRLSEAATVSAMMAAARLRGLDIRRLPPDPRLCPKPLPPLPRRGSQDNRPPATTENPAHTLPDSVLISVAPNPKKPGSKSHARYALYETGLTVRELRARGLSAADLRWDAEHGFLSFSDPASASTVHSEYTASPA